MSGEAAMSLVCSCAFFASNIEKKRKLKAMYMCMVGLVKGNPIFIPSVFLFFFGFV